MHEISEIVEIVTSTNMLLCVAAAVAALLAPCAPRPSAPWPSAPRPSAAPRRAATTLLEPPLPGDDDFDLEAFDLREPVPQSSRRKSKRGAVARAPDHERDAISLLSVDEISGLADDDTLIEEARRRAAKGGLTPVKPWSKKCSR